MLSSLVVLTHPRTAVPVPFRLSVLYAIRLYDLLALASACLIFVFVDRTGIWVSQLFMVATMLLADVTPHRSGVVT
jgi:hypothetical protein